MTDTELSGLMQEFCDGCTGGGWGGLNRHACCASFAVWVYTDDDGEDVIRLCGDHETFWSRRITGWGIEKVRRLLTVIYKLIPVMRTHAFSYMPTAWNRIINHALCGGEIRPATQDRGADVVGFPMWDHVEWPSE